MPRPLVLITMSRRVPVSKSEPSGPRVRPKRPELVLGDALPQALIAAGVTPVLLPPLLTPQAATELLERVDGLVLAGGYFDIHPKHYGEAPTGRIDSPDDARTLLELGLARAAISAELPCLGICGGLQAMAVATGGTLHQHVPELPGARDHEQATDPATPDHRVKLTSGLLQDIFGESVLVNSTHHQAVDDPGRLQIVGRAPDGVVEAAAGPGRFCIGVQWHPELLPSHAELFAAFSSACRTP